MLLIALLAFAVALLVVSVTAIAVGRRRRGVELEPPAAPARPKVRPPEPRPVQPPPPIVEEAPPVVEAPPVEEVPEAPRAPPEVPPRPRFRDRLGKARGLLAGYVGSILSRSAIDDETWDDLEEALIRADVGVSTTTALLDDLRTRVKAEGITTPQALVDALKDDLKKQLTQADPSLRYEPGAPNVWLFVGVNGVGKTTTIGKVALQQQEAGRSVVLAAGDTFRAAAGEQLELWAGRVDADI